MDNQRSLLLNWTYFHQEKGMDELRQSLELSMELEDTKQKAQEQLKSRDQQISQLKELLNRAIKEKTDAQEKCQKVMFEKILLQQQIQQHSGAGVSSVEDEPRRGLDSNNGFSSSDCDESIVSSPHHSAAADLPVALDRPLPEKGKLLQAVMKAGPLLQTLLLAGPLPQWRHPPPPLDTYQIPPPPVMVPSPANQDPFQSMINFNNCGRVTNQRKRGLCEGSDNSSSPVEFKYQRVVLH